MFLIVNDPDADLILAFCEIKTLAFMNPAPEPKYLEIFHKSWILKTQTPCWPHGPPVWTRVLGSGRGSSGLNANFDNFLHSVSLLRLDYRHLMFSFKFLIRLLTKCHFPLQCDILPTYSPRGATSGT